MPDCNLSFSFSKRGTKVLPGEDFQGEVVVKVDAPCRCDGLTLAAQWRTHGKGNAATGDAEVVTLFKGEWEAGEHRYRFKYKAPVGPFTYDGEFLNINWFLHARADVPWKIDPKVDAPFVLAAGPTSGTDAYFFGPLYKPPDPKLTRGVAETAHGGVEVKKPMSLGAKIGLGLVFAILFASIAFAIPAMAAIFAPFVAFFLIRKAMVKNKLGEPEVTIVPNPVRPGEEVMLVARVTPQKEVKLGKVYAELTGEERVVSGSGKHAHTHRHVLCTVRHSFPVEQREIRGGERVELRNTFTLPPNAALSFVASSNTVEWKVKLCIELLGWPDWEKSFPITVRPGALAPDAVTFARH